MKKTVPFMIVFLFLVAGVGCKGKSEEKLFSTRVKPPGADTTIPPVTTRAPEKIRVASVQLSYSRVNPTPHDTIETPHPVRLDTIITFSEPLPTGERPSISELRGEPRDGSEAGFFPVESGWDQDGTRLVLQLPSGGVFPPATTFFITIETDRIEKYETSFTTMTPGDVDGDGVADLIVGAPATASGSRNSYGMAVLLRGADLRGSTNSTPIASVNGWQDRGWLGYETRIMSDLNEDGYAEVMIAAPYVDVPSPFRAGAGEILIFDGKSLQGEKGRGDALVILPGHAEFEHFGSTITEVGDIDEDGIGDFAVGVGISFSSPGKVYLYSGAQVIKGRTQPLTTITGGTEGEFFGAVISGGKDVNADGIPDIAIGAPFWALRDSDGNIELSSLGHPQLGYGALFLFNGDLRGDKTETDSFASITTREQSSLLGSSVALGDINGDEVSDILVGAPGEENGKGVAYLFHGGRTGLNPSMNVSQADRFYEGENESDRFGSTVVISNLLEDSGKEVVIGAPYADQTGEISLFSGSNTTPTQMLYGSEPKDLFGYSLSVRERNLIVGAPGSTTTPPRNGRGAIFFFETLSSSPHVIEGSEDSGRFGFSLGGSR